MTHQRTIHPNTLASLRALREHGALNLAALRQHVPDLPARTASNLVAMGLAERTDDGGIRLTPKGQQRAAKPDALHAPLQASTAAPHAGQAQRTPRPAAPPATATLPMLSNAEIEERIHQALSRARVRITLADISRRTHMAEHLVRPTLTTMVQAGSVSTTAGKPALYALVKQADQDDVSPHHGDARTELCDRDYRCPELRRNPGMRADRFIAYDLPSRVGNRLHWPDGRVTPFAEHPGLPA